MQKLCRKLALMCFALFGASLAFELVARAAEPGPMRWLDVSPYEKSATLPHVHMPRARAQWDGSFYEIDSRGWRGPDVELDFDERELRVVAIGDSCTFGKAVEERDTWPRQFERLLQERLGPSRDVHVFNLGVNGYSSRDYLEVLRTQAAAVRPALVVLGYNINDFPNVVKKVDAQVFQGKQSLRSRVPWDMRERLSKLAAFRWLRATYYEWNRERDLQSVERVARSVGEESATAPEVLEEERARLAQMARECAAMGARLAMFLFPYESQVYLEDYSRAPLEGARSIAHAEGVLCFDLVERFRERARSTTPMQRLFVRGDRYHPNAAGYGIVARGALEAVENAQYLELGGKRD
jgi:lysophospholipase L1-like esterase